MNAYDVLRSLLHVGSAVMGQVVAIEELRWESGHPRGRATLATSTMADVTYLGYDWLLDEGEALQAHHLPRVGDELRVTVRNFVDGTLFVSARPSDLDPKSIRAWQEF